MTRRSAKLQGRSERVDMGSGAPLRRDRAKLTEPGFMTGIQKLQTMLQVAFPEGPFFADLQVLSLFDQAVSLIFLLRDIF